MRVILEKARCHGALQEEARRQFAENFRESLEDHRRAVEQERLKAMERARREHERFEQMWLEIHRREQERCEQMWLELHRRKQEREQMWLELIRREQERELKRLELHRREQERLEQHRCEQVRLEQHRLKQEQLGQHRREQEWLEQERREREATQSKLATQLRHYEDRWAKLHSNTAGTEHLKIDDIPWPLFDIVQSLEDITEERVLEFVGHPLQKHMQGPGGGLAKATRFEMLRWHPDKFNGKVLGQVVGEHREIVGAAAGRVARILTTLIEKMREL